MRLALAAGLLLLVAAACAGGGSVPTPTATPTPPASAAPATATPDPREAVAVLVADPAERVRLEAALASSAGFAPAAGAARVQWAIADIPLSGSRPLVLARWAAITDQRRDVLDLGRADVLRILRGEVRDWSQLGGSQQPIVAYLPASHVARIAGALGVPSAELAAELLPDGEVADRVASTPGAFALIAPEQLRLGVLALTVDGHDPYRDPARESPLSELRWIRAPGLGDVVRLAAVAGLEAAQPFDPAGMLVTGELIPARCTNAALADLDDYGAMFDGVRDAVAAADIAVAALETSLTDLAAPTPCVSTFVLQGSPRVVGAVSEAGVDVMLTAGNHMLDCREGCSGTGALLDTLARLEEAGIATAGAGEDLSAARAPAVVEVHTAHGFVRFAFLGYDSIAPWYAATAQKPGTAPLSAASVREDVRAALLLADHVVVGASWGVEYTADPTASQREIAGIAIEAGATFVIGNHPHWVQAVEHFESALVAYSFGNFVFESVLVGGDDPGDGDGTGIHARSANRLSDPSGRDPWRRRRATLDLPSRVRRPRRRGPPDPRSHLAGAGPAARAIGGATLAAAAEPAPPPSPPRGNPRPLARVLRVSAERGMPIDSARRIGRRVRHAPRVLPLPTAPALALSLAIVLGACSALPGGTPPPAALTATATPAAAPSPTATAAPTATPAPTPTAAPTATPAAATPTPEPGEAVAILVSDPAEAARLAVALASAAGFNPASGDAATQWAIADAPLSGSRPIVLARWAAITDQRRDVLDLERDDVLRILRGEVGNWFQLGGSPQPIAVYLPASEADRIAGALGIPPTELAAELLPDGEVVERVAGTPGAFALIEPEQLRLGVLALTVDGYDPYRDPARESPLSAVRWIRAPGLRDVVRLAAAAGLEGAAPFDPAGMLATGELIPVRCSDYVLAHLDDYGAMFDGGGRGDRLRRHHRHAP